MGKRQREFRGLLHTFSQGDNNIAHFLGNKHSLRWRLEVEPNRVRGLSGLEVVVKGDLKDGVIQVTGIVQANR